MDADQQLYSELKGDVETISNPLFDFAEGQVRKRGGFVPFGAVLSAVGKIQLQMAATEQETATSEELLPILLASLEKAATDPDRIAVAVAEWVKIGLDGAQLVDAIKVHVHHRRGLSIAFYLTAEKKLFRGWQFGQTIAKPSDPIIRAWAPSA